MLNKIVCFSPVNVSFFVGASALNLEWGRKDISHYLHVKSIVKSGQVWEHQFLFPFSLNEMIGNWLWKNCL
jgi:hypothetical protein